MRLVRTALAVAAGIVLAGCESLPLPQGSDLFQLNNEAQLAYQSGADAKAEQLYMALARQVPNDPEVWFRLGNLYVRNNKPDAAADAYQRALAIDSTDARVWYNLGIVRLRQGWAALIQANNTAKVKDPIYGQTDEMIQQLNRMTGLPPVSRPAPKQKKAD